MLRRTAVTDAESYLAMRSRNMADHAWMGGAFVDTAIHARFAG